MYRCHLCQVVVPARVAARRVVLQRRIRQYPVRPKAFRKIKHGKVEYVDDPGGIGWEIVREVLVCAACASLDDHPTADDTTTHFVPFIT